MHAPSFFYLKTSEWKLLHFAYFRLDYLIGLKIKFDVPHGNVQNELILQVKRLKMPFAASLFIYLSNKLPTE